VALISAKQHPSSQTQNILLTLLRTQGLKDQGTSLAHIEDELSTRYLGHVLLYVACEGYSHDRTRRKDCTQVHSQEAQVSSRVLGYWALWQGRLKLPIFRIKTPVEKVRRQDMRIAIISHSPTTHFRLPPLQRRARRRANVKPAPPRGGKLAPP
jgi:hypothetical protein